MSESPGTGTVHLKPLREKAEQGPHRGHMPPTTWRTMSCGAAAGNEVEPRPVHGGAPGPPLDFPKSSTSLAVPGPRAPGRPSARGAGRPGQSGAGRWAPDHPYPGPRQFLLGFWSGRSPEGPLDSGPAGRRVCLWLAFPGEGIELGLPGGLFPSRRHQPSPSWRHGGVEIKVPEWVRVESGGGWGSWGLSRVDQFGDDPDGPVLRIRRPGHLGRGWS